MNQLSDNHQRAIRSVAQLVENKLTEMEGAFLTLQNHEPVCVSITDDLSTEEKKAITETMSKLYGVLQNYVEHYAIPVQRLSLKKEIRFKTALLWQELSGATGKTMKNFGAMDADLKEEYDAYIREMTELVNELYALTEE